MKLDLSGKTALVCGSTRGIGKACALELARHGANVILLARNREALQQTKGELPASGDQKHDYLIADFSKPEEVQQRVSSFLTNSPAIHILINNTGGPPSGAIQQAKPEEFQAAFSSHLLCNHLLAQTVIPGMKNFGFGRIINIVSTSVKQPIKGLGVSNTVRAAVANWAKTLSVELAPHGITVNNVLPGATRTARLEEIIANRARVTGKSQEEVAAEMKAEIPAGRFGEPEEIAHAVAFLASPAAAYITGINLPVDGGRTLCL